MAMNNYWKCMLNQLKFTHNELSRLRAFSYGYPSFRNKILNFQSSQCLSSWSGLNVEFSYHLISREGFTAT